MPGSQKVEFPDQYTTITAIAEVVPQHGPLDALSKRGRADQSEGQDATAKRQFPGHILPPIGDFLPKRVQLDLLTAGHL